MISEWLKRRLCAVVGHRWVQSRAGNPVIVSFWLCKRCGRWSR